MCSLNDCWYHHTNVYKTKCLSIVMGEKWKFLTSIMYWLPSIMLQVYSKLTSDSKAIHPNNLQCPLFCTNTQISSTYGGFISFFSQSSKIWGGVTRFVGSLKSSFCEDRRMKDTQSLKCEDRRHQNFLALETEDLVTRPLAILLLSVHRSRVQVVVVQ